MPQRDYWWCIIVAKYGAFLFTELGAFVITDYMHFDRWIRYKKNKINEFECFRDFLKKYT